MPLDEERRDEWVEILLLAESRNKSARKDALSQARYQLEQFLEANGVPVHSGRVAEALQEFGVVAGLSDRELRPVFRVLRLRNIIEHENFDPPSPERVLLAVKTLCAFCLRNEIQRQQPASKSPRSDPPTDIKAQHTPSHVAPSTPHARPSTGSSSFRKARRVALLAALGLSAYFYWPEIREAVGVYWPHIAESVRRLGPGPPENSARWLGGCRWERDLLVCPLKDPDKDGGVYHTAIPLELRSGESAAVYHDKPVFAVSSHGMSQQGGPCTQWHVPIQMQGQPPASGFPAFAAIQPHTVIRIRKGMCR